MKPSEIYLEAAMLIDAWKVKYSCIAIRNAAKWSDSYLSLPIARDYEGFWGYARAELQNEIKRNATDDEARELRVWLLCMAAVIAEDEEKQ